MRARCFLEKLEEMGYDGDDLVVVSPDVGGVKLCRAYAKDLNAELAIVDKRRVGGSVTKVENMVGNVEGKRALIVDDMISTGGSITDAARVVREHGAREVTLLASHGVLCGPAVERLDEAPIERVLISNSIPLAEERRPKKLHSVSLAPMLAKAIDSIHRSESVSRLFDRENL
jgi:ribose-phosphate pyrophosphokinase